MDKNLLVSMYRKICIIQLLKKKMCRLVSFQILHRSEISKIDRRSIEKEADIGTILIDRLLFVSILPSNLTEINPLVD